MKDAVGRKINYMRISVTDRCNLRCSYCMPEEGIEEINHEEIMTYEEIMRVIDAVTAMGVNRIRLTGGEPLLRKGLIDFIKQIRTKYRDLFIGITTNGVLLSEMAQQLFEAGVNGINISLDTLDRERYIEFTKRDTLEKVKKGIEKALSIPFDKVKINSVLSFESLEEDWLSVIALAKEYPVDVRLIEMMPLSGGELKTGISPEEAKRIISKRFGNMLPLKKETGGPAEIYKIEGFKGRIGIIGAMSNCFCEECNRIRLTSDGDLKLCLFFDEGISLKNLLRKGVSDEELKEKISLAVLKKPEKHKSEKRRYEGDKPKLEEITEKKCMSKIGG